MVGSLDQGDVIVVFFPFTDLSGGKKRPALVLGEIPGGDIMMCAIKSAQYDNHDIEIQSPMDFAVGGLPKSTSYISPLKLTVIEKKHIDRHIGRITDPKINDVISIIKTFLDTGS